MPVAAAPGPGAPSWRTAHQCGAFVSVCNRRAARNIRSQNAGRLACASRVEGVRLEDTRSFRMHGGFEKRQMASPPATACFD
jgi:hypothetical protein